MDGTSVAGMGSHSPLPEHIVLGASGALGGAILKALISQGKPVTAVVRGRKGRVPLTGEGFRLLEADLRDVQSIAPVISPGAVLYFCVNVLYQLWEERMPAFLDAVLNASRGREISSSSRVMSMATALFSKCLRQRTIQRQPKPKKAA